VPYLERDPLRGIWVITSPERRKRPHEDRDRGFVCPFCPGNEHLTPPEIYRVPGGKDGWTVRVVPNRYPITDVHEVIVDSPDHDADLDTMDERHVNVLVEVWRERLEALRNHTYVLLFRNYGHGAGASIMHPHTQIVALDVVPDVVLREVENLRGPECVLCGMYGRKAFISGGYVVNVPEVQTVPYEVWIHPLSHKRRFSPAPPFGKLLSATVRALKREFNVRDYNLVLHQAPEGCDYHWHLEILPRMGRFAGFELGTGMRVVHYDPEEFAWKFTDIIATYVEGST